MKDGVWIVYYNPAIAIGYNTRSLKTFDSWARMWDPAMKERMMIPHPKTTQFAHMITMASHLETGKPFKEAQYDVDAGFRKLRTLRPNLLQSYLASAQASVLLEKGEAWAAAGFFTTYVQGRKAAGAPIDIARPKEGSFAYPKVIAKVRNAASPELADAWIDACISPEWQMVWQKEFSAHPPWPACLWSRAGRDQGPDPGGHGVAHRQDRRDERPVRPRDQDLKQGYLELSGLTRHSTPTSFLIPSRSRSTRANSSRCWGPRAAARQRCCGSSPGS